MKRLARRMPLTVIALIVVVALLAGGAALMWQNARCASAPAATPREPTAGEPVYWPTDGWRTADPAAHGVDGARLRAMSDFIRLKGLNIKAVVVIRNGYILQEHYGPGQGPDSRSEVYSVTKSVTSTLIGIAQRKGLLGGLDQKVVNLLAGEYDNMDAAKQGMTLEDALTMRSGLAWTEDDATIGAFYTSPEPVKFVLDQPLAAPPGTAFNYCSGGSHLLTAIVGKASGMLPQEFARRELFEPLGISPDGWLTDRNGVALGGWGLRLSAREMAKLGYLFLRGGAWDGREIVTRAWVEAATAVHADGGGTEPTGYGYHWWIHNRLGAYMALGRGGQIVYVRPAKDLIVAMRADDLHHDSFDYLVETYVEPAVK